METKLFQSSQINRQSMIHGVVTQRYTMGAAGAVEHPRRSKEHKANTVLTIVGFWTWPTTLPMPVLRY